MASHNSLIWQQQNKTLHHNDCNQVSKNHYNLTGYWIKSRGNSNWKAEVELVLVEVIGCCCWVVSCVDADRPSSSSLMHITGSTSSHGVEIWSRISFSWMWNLCDYIRTHAYLVLICQTIQLLFEFSDMRITKVNYYEEIFQFQLHNSSNTVIMLLTREHAEYHLNH